MDLPADIAAIAAEIGFDPADVEEHFVRGSGPGGQKINKTASAVQLLHRPTGLEVKVQRYREQSVNRLSAWKRLILKVEERKKGEASKRAREIYKKRKQKQKRSKRAKEKMLEGKARHADIKELRRAAWNAWRTEE